MSKKELKEERQKATSIINNAECFCTITDCGMEIYASPTELRSMFTLFCFRSEDFKEALLDVAHAIKDPKLFNIFQQNIANATNAKR